MIPSDCYVHWFLYQVFCDCSCRNLRGTILVVFLFSGSTCLCSICNFSFLCFQFERSSKFKWVDPDYDWCIFVLRFEFQLWTSWFKNNNILQKPNWISNMWRNLGKTSPRIIHISYFYSHQTKIVHINSPFFSLQILTSFSLFIKIKVNK